MKPTTTTRRLLKQPRRTLLSLALVATLSGSTFGVSSEAQAGCGIFQVFCDTANDVGNTITNTANDIGNTITNTANDAGNTITNTANDVANDTKTFTTEQWNNAKQTAKDGYDAAKNAVVNVAFNTLKNEAVGHYNEFLKKMQGIGNAFNSAPEMQTLATAVKNQNAVGIATRLPNVLRAAFVTSQGNSTLAQFEETLNSGKMGSLLLVFSGGAGAVLGASVDVGLAIDIAYVKYALEQWKLNPTNPATGLGYQGSLGSIFTAAGGSVGASIGGGLDFLFGYHAAPPNGVGGPGASVGAQVKFGGGVGFEVAWDISGVPWKLVAGTLALGAGAEFDASVGANFTAVIAKVCHNGTFQGGNNTCPAVAVEYTNLQNRWKPAEKIHIEYGSIASGTIQPGWASAKWTMEPVAGTEYVRLKNRWKPSQYIHIEHGSIASGTIQSGWHSAQWKKVLISGTSYFRLQNRWKPSQYIHIEHGVIASGAIQPGWHSAQWLSVGNL